jgi:hypothetical protein
MAELQQVVPQQFKARLQRLDCMEEEVRILSAMRTTMGKRTLKVADIEIAGFLPPLQPPFHFFGTSAPLFLPRELGQLPSLPTS